VRHPLDARTNPLIAAEANGTDIYLALHRARFDRVHNQLVFASHAVCCGKTYFVIPGPR
jgi:hypothetical protein